jgi:hypothetical protein
MSLLNASRHLQQHSQAAQSAQNTPPANVDRRSPVEPQTPRDSSFHAAGVMPELPPLMNVTSIPYSTPPVNALETVQIIPNFEVTLDEADRLLDLYRTAYSPQFPFVPIPLTMNAFELNDQRPFLFRTIIQAVAPQNAAVQRDVARWFREYIGVHMVVNQERRLELLQAIVVFLAWYAPKQTNS